MTAKQKNVVLVSIISIALLGCIVYANSLSGKFIWDDEVLIRDNGYIRNLTNLPRIFAGSIGAGAGRPDDFYRPVQMITYMADYAIWKLNVVGYHLTNLLLHIAAGLCVYWLIAILFKDPAVYLFASLLFVAHPVHTEAVSYMSGRADPLGLVFMLLCLIFYIKSLRNNSAAVSAIMILAAVMAFLSKESCLILVGLILVYHLAFKEKIKARSFFPLVIAAILYSILRIAVLGLSLPQKAYIQPLPQRLAGFFIALTEYLRILLVPFNLHMEYVKLDSSLAEPASILGITILCALLVCAKLKRNDRLIFFSISWFVVAILPVSNVVYPVNAYMAEHWLYVPSIGFFLILANAVVALSRKKALRVFAITCAALILVFYAGLTIRQNNYWKEPIAFYERTLSFTRQSPRLFNNLGKAYREAGNNEKALPFFKKAVELDPRLVEAHNNIGIVYSALGMEKDAIISLEKAIAANPSYADAYYNLGNSYFDAGRKDDAIAYFIKAIELNPRHVYAYNNLGFAYKDAGKNDEAIAAFKKAIEFDPGYADAYDNIGIAYVETGRIQDGIDAFKEAIRLNPNEASWYKNLGNAMIASGAKEGAIPYFKAALKLDPRSAVSCGKLAKIYYETGQYALAAEYYRKAVALGYKFDKDFTKAISGHDI